jgi:pullulanase/glycogen debranching enzyme
MISMGDEVARTQNGSNNAYSMPKKMKIDLPDSVETFNGGWAKKWDLDSYESDMQDAFAELASIRKTYLEGVAHEFFTGAMDAGTERKDIAWFGLHGDEMLESHWQDGDLRTLSVFIEAGSARGLLLILNSSREEITFTLPNDKWGHSYRRIFDASTFVATHEPIIATPSSLVTVKPHCAQVWLVTRG